ncbi:hypothetical protein ACRE_030390 [Hapsidospora chrysogenum ATCC 11550]|uniref:Uncharacterized protein n=1 Tax=Hapsidospora chrysogenum (strain ATCC 11550 / CBS 779.69 / DSM 880 / IAM 14645 / JCM 23072 / IMI 49137) TaxID=857340 RepID=A0A086T9M9_HAPC1|nr:hypothetical protein ACRE_030390 [Hapsidospora chrysogenum ATCC 11550]
MPQHLDYVPALHDRDPGFRGEVVEPITAPVGLIGPPLPSSVLTSIIIRHFHVSVPCQRVLRCNMVPCFLLIDSLEDHIKEMQESTNALSSASSAFINTRNGLDVQAWEWAPVDDVVRAESEIRDLS